MIRTGWFLVGFGFGVMVGGFMGLADHHRLEVQAAGIDSLFRNQERHQFVLESLSRIERRETGMFLELDQRIERLEHTRRASSKPIQKLDCNSLQPSYATGEYGPMPEHGQAGDRRSYTK